MDEGTWLAEQFEENRSHLRAVAYRMLGSPSEADDAVQEAWIRLSRSDVSGIDNLAGWLTTVVARVSLDMLRSRRTRREEPLDEGAPEPIVSLSPKVDPEQEALLADSVGPALLVVLETLAPAERVAFVLHDMFAVPFDEIAQILGRTPAATRQLASRARRRVQGAGRDRPTQRALQREVVNAFLAASRGGDFEALLEVLHPDVVLRADEAAVQMAASRAAQGAPRLVGEVRGPGIVAETFSGRAGAARPALVDGSAGAVWATGGRPRAVFAFSLRDGKVVEIDLVADPERIGHLDLVLLDD